MKKQRVRKLESTLQAWQDAMRTYYKTGDRGNSTQLFRSLLCMGADLDVLLDMSAEMETEVALSIGG